MTAGWIGPAGRSPSLMSPESEAKASASPPLLRYGERPTVPIRHRHAVSATRRARPRAGDMSGGGRPMPEADRRHFDGSSAEVRK